MPAPTMEELEGKIAKLKERVGKAKAGDDAAEQRAAGKALRRAQRRVNKMKALVTSRSAAGKKGDAAEG